MPHNPSASDATVAGRNKVQNTVMGLLRRAQREGWTDEALSDASGVPARTIKTYRLDGKDPCLTNALSLACALGVDAVNSVLACIGYGGAKPLDEPDEMQPSVIVAKGLQSFAVIAKAAADNRFDHSERPECRAAADEIIAVVLPLSSAGDAG